MSKTIGITGISGFIAGYTAEACLKRGYKVIGLDHHQKDASHYPKGIELFIGDMRDVSAMTEFAAHIDSGIIHLAGVLGTSETVRFPRPAAESNIQGGLNFLEACNQYDLPGVYICVGNWYTDSTYAISKTTVERFCHMFNNDRGGKINLLRVVNAIGPRQSVAEPFGSSKVRKMVPSFACRALSGMPIEVYGSGEQISDCVFVSDVAEALVRCLERALEGDIFDKVVEIGPTEHKTVNEIAEYINKLTGNKQPIEHIAMRLGEKEGTDVMADTSTLSLIGMDPEQLMPLNIGLRETIKYFKDSEGKAWSKPDVS